MKKLTIADKQKVCRFILHNTELNTIVAKHHSKFLIKELLGGEKDIDHIEVRQSPTLRQNREFCVVRTDGSKMKFNYVKYLAQEQLNSKSYE